MHGKHVLITGAGGFIGSHLSERLVRLGAEVTAFLHYNSRRDIGALQFADTAVLRAMRLDWGDLQDGDAVAKAVHGKDVVFHLGALIAIPYSYRHPRDVINTNVIGTANVLTACAGTGVERLIHTSTSEVYGTAQRVPMDETHPLRAQSPYAASKIAADKLVESYHRSFGMPATIVRPFNTFGPRQSARAVIPAIISQALRATTIKLGDLTPVRDFTYVTDTVEGFIAAATASDAVGKEINLGTGVGVSIGEVVDRILTITSSAVQVVKDESRIRPTQSEVGRLISDNRQAKDILDWEPRVNLDEGLIQTVDWVAQHPELFDVDAYAV